MNLPAVDYTLHYRVIYEIFREIPKTITRSEARAIRLEVDRLRRAGEPAKWHLQP